ncbi:hypothetical protein BD626DRAFT_517448 [Schizophyllum amplum]|uniref:Uncharacterized protein n=1 Tax=Schizophyllum amplum TaxID=97359 RepID=A0A550BW88_9AGAR|nr:hypothetical protein BD626DRAFT_517448 [Auriculariopsis ampla]
MPAVSKANRAHLGNLQMGATCAVKRVMEHMSPRKSPHKKKRSSDQENGKQVAWVAKKYRGHRCLPPNIMSWT